MYLIKFQKKKINLLNNCEKQRFIGLYDKLIIIEYI